MKIDKEKILENVYLILFISFVFLLNIVED